MMMPLYNNSINNAYKRLESNHKNLKLKLPIEIEKLRWKVKANIKLVYDSRCIYSKFNDVNLGRFKKSRMIEYIYIILNSKTLKWWYKWYAEFCIKKSKMTKNKLKKKIELLKY